MRILLINHEYPPLGGGGGNATAQIACCLVALGQEVAILTTRFKDQPAYEEVNGVQIWRVTTPRKYADRSSVSEFVAFMVLALGPTLKRVRAWKPDGAIAFFGLPGGLLTMIAKWLYGTPYIVSLRGGDVPGFWYPGISIYHTLSKPLIQLIWRQAIAVVANSDGLQKLALKTCPELPIQVIPNGVDSQLFCPNPHPVESTEVKLLLVGRTVYQKGIDVLLDALAIVNDKLDQPWQLEIVGDGGDRPQFEAQADQLGLADRVHFRGWVDRSKLVDIYQNADIFVFPSRDEGMPNALLEAMACGLPAIASRIAGNEELVVDGSTGFLVASEDVPALSQALVTLITQSDLRQQMGNAGRERVEQTYSWQRETEAYFQTLVNQSS